MQAPKRPRQLANMDLELPTEILMLVFSFLNLRSLLMGASLVCKRWNVTAAQNPIWKALYRRRWKVKREDMVLTPGYTCWLEEYKNSHLASSWKPVNICAVSKSEVWNCSWNHAGTMLATSGKEGLLTVFELKYAPPTSDSAGTVASPLPSKPMLTIFRHYFRPDRIVHRQYSIFSHVWSPDDRFILCTNTADEVFIYHVATGQLLLRTHTVGFDCAASFFPSGRSMLLSNRMHSTGTWREKNFRNSICLARRNIQFIRRIDLLELRKTASTPQTSTDSATATSTSEPNPTEEWRVENYWCPLENMRLICTSHNFLHHLTVFNSGNRIMVTTGYSVHHPNQICFIEAWGNDTTPPDPQRDVVYILNGSAMEAPQEGEHVGMHEHEEEPEERDEEDEAMARFERLMEALEERYEAEEEAEAQLHARREDEEGDEDMEDVEEDAREHENDMHNADYEAEEVEEEDRVEEEQNEAEEVEVVDGEHTNAANHPADDDEEEVQGEDIPEDILRRIPKLDKDTLATITCDGHVLGLSLSPDDEYLAVNVRRWADPVQAEKDHREYVPTKLVQEFELRIYHVPSMRLVRILTGHKDTVSDMHTPFLVWPVWSPDGRFLATGSDNGSTFIFHVAHGVKLAELTGVHTSFTNTSSWNPVRRDLLATASDDATVALWQCGSRIAEADNSS